MEFYAASDSFYDELDRETVRAKGVVYTPRWLSEHITNNAISQWKKLHGGEVPNLAADLSCGTGVFLFELENSFSRLGWSTKIEGYDIDTGAISFAKSYFQRSELVSRIETQDTLLSTDSNFSERYDIIVGNPPYISSSKLPRDYKEAISSKFYSASRGNFDLSIVFVEKVIRALNPNGIASLILSNKFMTSKYGRLICEFIAKECHILTIEDFNDQQVFRGQTTYTCILTFIKAKPGRKHTYINYHASERKVIEQLPKFDKETVSHESIETHPWRFHAPQEVEIQRKLNSEQTLSVLEVFQDIYQGVRTGANDIFIRSKERSLAEEGINLKFVSGENIKGIKVSEIDQTIIYPYYIENGCTKPYTEEELSKKYPATYSYLVSKFDVLSARSVQGRANWFEFSRSQSLSAVWKSKILIREMMPAATFAYDANGEYAFSSGYAFSCEGFDSHTGYIWASVLSTPVMEFALRKVGTQLHSGWFRVMKNHLLRLRLPKFSDKQYSELKKAVSFDGSVVEQEKVNKIVEDAFELSAEEISYIEELLATVHLRSQPKGSLVRSEEEIYQPVRLEKYNKYHVERSDLRSSVTFTPNKKQPIHNWYKYTQGFSSGLVNRLLDELSPIKKPFVFDPFNGCGTTTTVCSYRGVSSVGYEISPLMCEVAKVKSQSWDLESIREAIEHLSRADIYESSCEEFIFPEYFNKAYSQKILSQVVSLRDHIFNLGDSKVQDLMKLALISILEEISVIRKHGSHYRFLNNSSSVGLQKLNISVMDENADVKSVFANKLRKMYEDLCVSGGQPQGIASIVCGSSFDTTLADDSVDMVITSPPYLNRNNYIAQQKSELDILKMVSSKAQYKELVKSSFRSHTDANLDLIPTSQFPYVNKILKNIQLEKSNNAKIPHMIVGYFDDLKSSLTEVYRVLRNGGIASFVVGNTRWGGVVVPIDHLLCDIAEAVGFKVESIYVTRLKGNSPQQMKKFGRIPVRESIVNLKK